MDFRHEKMNFQEKLKIATHTNITIDVVGLWDTQSEVQKIIDINYVHEVIWVEIPCFYTSLVRSVLFSEIEGSESIKLLWKSGFKNDV